VPVVHPDTFDFRKYGFHPWQIIASIVIVGVVFNPDIVWWAGHGARDRTRRERLKSYENVNALCNAAETACSSHETYY
jgi:hypothetical protein